ncbi:hypothetical protein OAO48_04445 [Alphaproteobacteria bacterium]|nr:hypothetical protein [Alphaproteobacteria bacterium]
MLIDDSYDVAKNHWDKRLKINIHRRSLISHNINIDGDEAKFAEKAGKYLDPEYKYQFED